MSNFYTDANGLERLITAPTGDAGQAIDGNFGIISTVLSSLEAGGSFLPLAGGIMSGAIQLDDGVVIEPAYSIEYGPGPLGNFAFDDYYQPILNAYNLLAASAQPVLSIDANDNPQLIGYSGGVAISAIGFDGTGNPTFTGILSGNGSGLTGLPSTKTFAYFMG